MDGKVKAVPDGYHTATAYLHVKRAVKAIEYYKKAFGAIEVGRINMAGGKLGHAELRIGDSSIMLADENPQWGNKGPDTLGGTSVGIHLYVPDVDAVFKRAVDAGGKVAMPVQDMFYGDRFGTVTDPFGHQWHIATHKEDVSWPEMQKRADNMFKEHKPA